MSPLLYSPTRHSLTVLDLEVAHNRRLSMGSHSCEEDPGSNKTDLIFLL